MADLSLDLSPYQALSRPPSSGLANMDIGGLLGLVARSRELQTQSAIADALRANPDDPQAALKSVLANPRAFPGPETVSNFAHAAGAQFELNRGYMREAAGAMGSLITKPNATADDFNNIVPLLRQYHVPQAMIDDVLNSAKGPRGALDRTKLTSLYNWISGNAGVPGQPSATVTGPYGTSQTPPAQALYGGGNQGAAAGVPTPTPRPNVATPAAPQAPGALQSNQSSADAATAETRRQFESGGYGIGPGGTTTNPSQSIQSAWDAGGKLYDAATINANNYRNDVTPLEKSIGILKDDPNLTGRGKEELNNLKNFLHSLGAIPDSEMAGVTKFEQLKKYLAGFANSSSIGGTDSRMFQQIAASPSVDKLGSTNLNVARVILALRRMQQVGLKEFEAQQGANGQPLPPGYFSRWMSSWSARQDPMAFVWDTMSPEEKAAYAKDHWKGQAADQPGSNSELRRFRDSLAAGQRTEGVMGGQ